MACAAVAANQAPVRFIGEDLASHGDPFFAVTMRKIGGRFRLLTYVSQLLDVPPIDLILLRHFLVNHRHRPSLNAAAGGDAKESAMPQGNNGGGNGGSSKRGFAAMSKAKQREIASKGGKASHGGGGNEGGGRGGNR